jgi:ATP-binding protein involved in chromosome partitioning
MSNDQQTAQQEQDARLEKNMQDIKHTLLVMSGKGGVGKSTVAVNIALGLAEKGYEVGILDVDIHGPNIAKMLGIEDRVLEADGNEIEPVEVIPHLKAISLALAGYGHDTPIIWRGPLKMGAIKQFLADVRWGSLDYLIIDSPPGTGDEPLSVCQLIPKMDGAVIVTTPQDVAILDSRKSINFARQLQIPVLGVVENMSGFICPHCDKEVDLFGTGGGERAAEDMGVPFLGRIPMDPRIVKSGDQGRPYIAAVRESPTADAIREMVGSLEESTKSRSR